MLIFSILGYFIHITDIHYDANYSTNGRILDMCHIPLNNTDGIGDDVISQWGNYDCDSPWALVESGMSFLKERFHSPNFIIWTG